MARRLGVAAVALLVGAAAGIGGWVYFAALGERHAEATSRSLYLSLVDATPSLDPLDRPTDTCAPAGDPRTWTCDVPDAEASGGATYRVRVRPDGSCWDAQRIRHGFGMPERASECVRRKHT